MQSMKVQVPIVGKFRENALVARHNNLIEARHKLTLQEQRVIYWLAAQIRPDDSEFNTYTVNIKELAGFLEIEKNKNIYEEIRETTKRLIGRVFELYDPDTQILLQVSPLSSAAYSINKGSVELCFDKKMRPYLLQLRDQAGGFTKIELKYLMRLKSVYAQRIYELIKRNIFKGGKFEIELSKLRNMVGLEKNQYQRFQNFNQRILEVAKKEINTKTEIKVKYEFKRTGRKITHIVFITSKQGRLPTTTNIPL